MMFDVMTSFGRCALRCQFLTHTANVIDYVILIMYHWLSIYIYYYYFISVFAQDYYGASAGRRRVGGVSRTVIIDRGVGTGGLVDHGPTGVLTHTHGVGSVGVGRVIDRGVGTLGGVHDIGRGGVIDHVGVIDRHDLHGGLREGRLITGGRAGYGGRRRGGRARICRLRGEVPSLDRSGRPEWCSRDPRYNYCEDRRATCRIGRFGGGVCCKSRKFTHTLPSCFADPT